MKKYFYYILFVINIISIVACCFNLNIYNEIIFLPMIILICFEIYMILKKNFIIGLKCDKKIILFSIFLCILFLIMLPIDSCLNMILPFSNIFIINCIFKIIFLISLFFSLLLIFIIIFSYECQTTPNIGKTKKIIMLIITIISLIFIMSTSTGFYDYDFPNIWTRELQGWHNWHTFGFTFLLYFCRILLNNPYPIVILNFILYIYFCNYALTILERQSNNKNILVLFLLINLFTMVGFDQLRYIKKDILFSLGFCNLILTIVDYFIQNKFTKKIVINLIVFSIFTALFRHGGIYLLIFILFTLMIIILVKKQYTRLMYVGLTLLIVFVSYFGLNYIGFNILHANKYPKNIIYTVPIYQVGAFANENYEFDEADKEYLEEYLPIEYMANNFEKHDGDALARGWRVPPNLDHSDSFNYRGLIKINYKLFITQPLFYIKSLLNLSSILWRIEPFEDEEQIYFFKSTWDDWEHAEQYKDYKIESKETILNKVVEPIINIGLKKILFNFRIRGAFPLFMLILSSCIFFIKRKYQFLFPVIFILFWYICLFLSIPFSLVRYVIPFINIYPFIFCLSLGEKKQLK